MLCFGAFFRYLSITLREICRKLPGLPLFSKAASLSACLIL